MRTINSISIVGRLTRPVEIRPNSEPNKNGLIGGYAYFSLANVQRSIRQEDGSYKDDPRFYNCKLSIGDVNGKYAEYLSSLTTKDILSVEGVEDYYTSSKDGKVYHSIVVKQFGALNKMVIAGNISKEPFTRMSIDEDAKPNTGYTYFTIATTLYGKEKPLYQKCSLNIYNYDKFIPLKTGDRVIAEGYLVTQEKEKDGQKRSENVLICNPLTTTILRKEVKAAVETEVPEETTPQTPAPKKFKAIVKTSVVEEEPPVQTEDLFENEPFEGEDIPF